MVYESSKSGNRFKESVIELRELPNPEDIPHITISINESQSYQKIIGFGGAFTDVTGFVLNSVPKGLSDHIMKSYFSGDGIEYNMGRVPIAATDYSFRRYTYDDIPEDKNLTHFALAMEDHEYKIPHIKTAQRLSTAPLKLFGSPWMAPNWIKTENTTNEIKGEVGGVYYDVWANYFVK